MTAHDAQDAALAHHEDELPSDEPSTPMWMPLLGGVLLLAGLGAFLALAPTGKSGKELATEAAAAAQPQAGEAGQPEPGNAERPQPGNPAQRQAEPRGHGQPGPGAVQARPAPAPQPAMPSGGCGEM